MVDYIAIVISKRQVETSDYSEIVETLKSLLETPIKAKQFKENVDISFDGYDQDTRELFEIPEVRNYIFDLDNQFPFWLFFLSKFGTGLQCIFYSMMPPFLTSEAKATIFPQKMSEILLNRWFPAMNQICEFVGMNEKEIESLSDRGVSYLTDGVFKTGKTI
jgi:hypothetical protein